MYLLPCFQEGNVSLSFSVSNFCEELQTTLTIQESLSALKTKVTALKESLKYARYQLEEAKWPRAQLQPCSYAESTIKASTARGSTTQCNGTNKKNPSNRAKNSNASQSQPRSDNAQHVGKHKVADLC